MKKIILPESFYLKSDVVTLSKEFLGKVLCTNINGQYTAGIITETEAYSGFNDKASHTYNGRKTKRNEVMYREGGITYIYLCYGIHHLFNVVTNVEGIAQATLIRGILPLEGIDIMLKRRNRQKLSKNLTAGPGTLSQALGLKSSQSGTSLQSKKIWIEDRGIKIEENNIVVGRRIGIDYAGEDAELPYRFYVKNLNRLREKVKDR